MTETSRRRTVIILVLAMLIAIALLLTRCPQKKPSPAAVERGTSISQQPGSPQNGVPATRGDAELHADEVLTAATLTAPARVTAGASFSVTWTGPDNRDDYVTIVPSDALASDYGNYQETSRGTSLELLAPMTPGHHEVRYVAGRSRTILGRAPVEVLPTAATLEASAEVPLGAPFEVMWSGPNNKGDYVTIVPAGAPDDQYGDYVDTNKGSPLNLTAPTVPGEAELRYVSGQGREVLARRAIRIAAAEVSLGAPAEAIAGTTIQVVWTGPKNAGDYITVVARETPDGQYGNYADTSKGSPLNLLLPIMNGSAELRYMTGQGRRVLGRRAITIVAAEVMLSAPAEGAAGTDVSITWTGPNNPGDYITIVAKDTPDGRYAAYTETSKGSPLSVKMPPDPGEAEVRYMTGQGNKVLTRIPIKVTR